MKISTLIKFEAFLAIQVVSIATTNASDDVADPEAHYMAPSASDEKAEATGSEATFSYASTEEEVEEEEDVDLEGRQTTLCSLSGDTCVFKLDWECDAGILCPSGTDCLDCNALQVYRSSCETCIRNGGRYCFVGSRSNCVQPQVANYYPNACLGAGGSAWMSSCPRPQPPNPNPDPGPCMSGHSTLQVKRKGIVRMDALEVGDEVLSAGGTFSKVYTFSHKDESKEVTYLQILTESMAEKHSLEITERHMLFVNDRNGSKTRLAFAQDVKVGDLLASTSNADRPFSRVVSIQAIQRQGLYTPMTASGTIVVNGVLVSCYTALGFLDAVLSKPMIERLSHGAMVPYRLFCSLVGCYDESYDTEHGYNPWVGFLYDIKVVLTSSSHSILVKMLIMLACAIPAVLALTVGMVLTMDYNATTLIQILTVFVGFAILWQSGIFKSKKSAAQMKAA